MAANAPEVLSLPAARYGVQFRLQHRTIIALRGYGGLHGCPNRIITMRVY